MSTGITYTQVTPANRNTVDYPGMCARFQWKAFGAQNGWGFGSAREAWNGQANKHPGELPPGGVDVPIWLSWDLDPNWHAAVMLSNGQVMTSPVSPNPNTPRQDRFPSIGAMIAAFPGNMRYLGWAESMDGTRVVRPISNPTPLTGEEEDDMRPVYFKLQGKTEYLVTHPDIGSDLDVAATRVIGNVTYGRGYMTTKSPGIGDAWSKMYIRPSWFSVTQDSFNSLKSEAQRAASHLGKQK